ncbi:hypothetical protein BGZ81_000997 [Podila clonocystis]|nr:hypothetical protein BGZ81_000997 [Podila clonocystis]
MSATLSPKAQTVEREFLAARAMSDHAAFAELTRRYVKHNPEGVVFANTALLEQAIAEADVEARKVYKWSPTASLDDTPEEMSISPRYDPEIIRGPVERLETSVTQGSEEHQEQAAYILARGALRTTAPDRLQRVAHYLQNIQLPPTRLPTGYSLALVVSGLVVKGLATEEDGDVPGGIALYDSATDLVLASPNDRSPELANWIEHALYRGGLLKLRLGDQRAAVRTFRNYHKMSLTWPTNFRITRRITIYNYYAKTLAAFYRVNITGDSTASDDFSSASIACELPSVHTYWEESLFGFVQFPKAGEINWRVLDLIERIVDDRKLIGFSSEASKRSHVELIYRASQKTFQSPRLLRFLFFAQVNAGLYGEADVTLQAYWDRIQTDSQVKNHTDSALTLEQRIHQDVESESETATVLVAGSRLYSNNLSKPAQAQLFAERSLAFIQKAPQNEENQLLLHDANKYQAAALGLLASEAHDPEKRPELYAKAVESLERAVQILPESYDGHYLLALQLAEMRETSRAITSVKQSLALHTAHIPSWHLLALLLSAKKDFIRALDVCAVGLKESLWDLPETDLISAAQVDGDEYLALRITQVQLLDQVHGPEATLEPQEALFALYTKVFAPDPSTLDDGRDNIQSVRRRDQCEDMVSSAAGRPRAGSILTVRSRRGSEVGAANGTAEVARTNYASSVTSLGSTGSKGHRNSSLPIQAGNGTVNGNGTIGRSGVSLPPAIQTASGKSQQRTARANKVLVTLWLMSAATFRRLDRMDDALKAIEEAERVDSSNPDVWYQLGLFHTVQKEQNAASIAFIKATVLEPYHPASLTRIGKNYIEAGSLEMAESMLDAATRSHGWDNAEAWFCLGKVFEDTNRLSRAKECLWYALDLEASRPVRGYPEALPRFLD